MHKSQRKKKGQRQSAKSGMAPGTPVFIRRTKRTEGGSRNQTVTGFMKFDVPYERVQEYGVSCADGVQGVDKAYQKKILRS